MGFTWDRERQDGAAVRPGSPRGWCEGATCHGTWLSGEYRELGGVLRDLRDRGLATPHVAVGDGALGLWAALDEVFPDTGHQRCWNHRVLNVQSTFPKRMHAEARRRLRQISDAQTQVECEQLRDLYAEELMAADHRGAASRHQPTGNRSRLIKLKAGGIFHNS